MLNNKPLQTSLSIDGFDTEQYASRRYCSVVIDIPTKALDQTFTYFVPPSLQDTVEVGVCVLVYFGGRPTVGYVVEDNVSLPKNIAAKDIKPIVQILASSVFDEYSAQTALWIAKEYASPLIDAVLLFCPPGRKTQIKKNKTTGTYQLIEPKLGAVDDRWVELQKPISEIKIAKNASRQRAVITALSEGPVRIAELSININGVSSVVNTLEKRGYVKVTHKRRIRGDHSTTLSSAVAKKIDRSEYTLGQNKSIETIEAAINNNRDDVVCIDGVTGSGKTEVYLEAIQTVLLQGQGACVLVPEIALTPQTVGRFRSRFGDKVAVLHSRMSPGERYDQWDLCAQGIAQVVVGPRSALFAPIKNLGLIVIDEEHETTYKQGSSPRYHAREVAAKIAQKRSIPLVLGSATLSIETLARCKQGEYLGQRWILVSMPERVANRNLPEIKVVDMTTEFNQGHKSMFSRELEDGLRKVVKKKQKAVLLLNRRGFARFLLCRECGYVPQCVHCSTSLTYHAKQNVLMCHSCDYTTPMLATCPKCGSRYLRQFGTGTQRVEEELRALLPKDYPVIRMDADTTKGKDGHNRLLEKFDAKESAVLLGTQMIAKGLDFPDVTLVGVINADTTLKFPDFRAGEKTYALLEQVSGRAGRGEHGGTVVIQTYLPQHPAIVSVKKHDRSIFLEDEIEERKELGYPPFKRLANVLFWGKREDRVKAYTMQVAKNVLSCIVNMPEVTLHGPAPATISKLKDDYRFHFLVKAPINFDLGPFLKNALLMNDRVRGINTAIDVDPYEIL